MLLYSVEFRIRSSSSGRHLDLLRKDKLYQPGIVPLSNQRLKAAEVLAAGGMSELIPCYVKVVVRA